MISLDVNFFFQVINFIVLYLILRHFLYEPVTNFMEERSEKISNRIEEAERKNE